jgi:hypothetical protein
MLRTYLVCKKKREREREREINKQTARGRSTQFTNNNDPITSTYNVTAHIHQSDHCATENHRPNSAVRPIDRYRPQHFNMLVSWCIGTGAGCWTKFVLNWAVATALYETRTWSYIQFLLYNKIVLMLREITVRQYRCLSVVSCRHFTPTACLETLLKTSFLI